MRELIENPRYMTYEEMRDAFEGRWVLIVNCNYTEHSKMLGGTPVAVADTVFEGQSDGFYNEFKDPKYAPRNDRFFEGNVFPDLPGNVSLEWVGGEVSANT